MIGQPDAHARVQKGELAQAMLQHLVGELGLREHLDRGHEGDFGAAPFVLRTHGGQGGYRLAALDEAHAVLVAVAPDAQVQPVGQPIDHRDANAMQSARHLVGVLIELPAGVQDGHDHLGGGHTLALVDVDRDAATIVGHGDGAVGVDRAVHLGGVAGQGLVDRVVDRLEHHVVQARAVVGVADVHARAHAHGFQPLQHLDRTGIVDAVGLRDGFTHGASALR